ncbi:hypothetical protein PMI04_004695 [Sphingobium sp. AP49]|uniref:hypothetical protein n=1 Tax=Sphingobium sp. AP49 TaxID=1144307 RepID=UPI0012F67069|nr:hypothetical protein [Sphingobium sp. AP49]WHO39896.1 hypothetical protein PMI04_004695 [Sphingobium sp. AP49]
MDIAETYLNCLMADQIPSVAGAEIDFAECRLSDAEIISIRPIVDDLLVEYKDWREQHHSLIFKDIAGYQVFCAEGTSLSHGAYVSTDPLIDIACMALGDANPHDFHAYSFISAWTNRSVLCIIAKRILAQSSAS